MAETWALLATIFLISMVPPATLFPLVYLRSPWRLSPVGRGLMVSSVGMALLVDFAVLSRITNDPAPEWLRALVFGIITTGLYYQFVNLIRAQRRRKACERQEEPA